MTIIDTPTNIMTMTAAEFNAEYTRMTDAKIDTLRRGRLLIREYYDAEALREMWHDFQELRLPGEEFPAYVAYCYDNEQAEPYLGAWW